MKRIVLAGAAVCVLTGGVVMLRSQGATRVMTVQRDTGCGCCMNWVTHLQRAGFKVTVSESSERDVISNKRGIPQAVRSCHTGVVDGYFIEGHVPADDIKRLLKERPAGVMGIATPGMPAGSPGMEVPGGRRDPYDVMAFDKAGNTRVLASHR